MTGQWERARRPVLFRPIGSGFRRRNSLLTSRACGSRRSPPGVPRTSTARFRTDPWRSRGRSALTSSPSPAHSVSRSWAASRRGRVSSGSASVRVSPRRSSAHPRPSSSISMSRRIGSGAAGRRRSLKGLPRRNRLTPPRGCSRTMSAVESQTRPSAIPSFDSIDLYTRELMTRRTGAVLAHRATSSFVAALGFGPKAFQRILRFQGFLALSQGLHSRHIGLARLAKQAGYADQSHLTRESSALTGLTPKAFLEEMWSSCGTNHDHEASYGGRRRASSSYSASSSARPTDTSARRGRAGGRRGSPGVAACRGCS